MSQSLHIRPVNEADAADLLEIYRPFVEDTAISFEIEVPSVADFELRIRSAAEKWLWLVAERNDMPIGYAYGSAHRPREAYKYSVETSAYVHRDYHRQGVARLLYNKLLIGLTTRGYRNAYAGITLPNEASMAFHKSVGFEYIGVFPRVGNKFEQWHDVAWLHRPLSGSE